MHLHFRIHLVRHCRCVFFAAFHWALRARGTAQKTAHWRYSKYLLVVVVVVRCAGRMQCMISNVVPTRSPPNETIAANLVALRLSCDFSCCARRRSAAACVVVRGGTRFFLTIASSRDNKYARDFCSTLLITHWLLQTAHHSQELFFIQFYSVFMILNEFYWILLQIFMNKIGGKC